MLCAWQHSSFSIHVVNILITAPVIQLYSTVMLLWFVDKKVAEMALKQAVLIEEEHVECRPERITDAVVDENVDVHLIRKYFTYDAWLLVEQVLKRKQEKMTCMDLQCLSSRSTCQDVRAFNCM